MATVKIPAAVVQVLISMTADVVASVVKNVAEELITSKKRGKRMRMRIPSGYGVRIRYTP